MKFKVDQALCVGCGACEGMCPEVFEMVNDKAQVKLDPVPEELRVIASAAEGGCPVEAISRQE